MTKLFQFTDISRYRSELMGWAIVWIMMLHFTFNQIKPLGFIAQYGFAGVEIFMMVSGLGLYFALDKNKDLRNYYKRRLIRIFPTYYFIGFFASLFLFHDTLFPYLFRYSTIGFWIGGPSWEWYVPSIVALYIIAPFIKEIIDKGQTAAILIICIFIIAISYYIVSNDIVEAKEPHFFLLYRIPAFILGMICAYWIKNSTSTKYFYILLLIGLPCFVILFPRHHQIYNYKYLSLSFLLPAFTICFINLSKFLKPLNPILACIGKASLEIYLIQAIFFNSIISGQLEISSAWHDAITIALIIISSLIGIIVHKIIDMSGILRKI